MLKHLSLEMCVKSTTEQQHIQQMKNIHIDSKELIQHS